VLAAVSAETPGRTGEGALKQHTRRVDDLEPAGGRLESPTANGHWSVTEEGLVPWGQSQDHRPARLLLAALEPWGLPVATDGVPGQRAADPVYVPASTRVREGLGRRGRW
jgi:hypothetical protein